VKRDLDLADVEAGEGGEGDQCGGCVHAPVAPMVATRESGRWFGFPVQNELVYYHLCNSFKLNGSTKSNHHVPEDTDLVLWIIAHFISALIYLK
jgi:hypothetical protein